MLGDIVTMYMLKYVRHPANAYSVYNVLGDPLSSSFSLDFDCARSSYTNIDTLKSIPAWTVSYVQFMYLDYAASPSISRLQNSSGFDSPKDLSPCFSLLEFAL
jgi:hypothetical protein